MWFSYTVTIISFAIFCTINDDSSYALSIMFLMPHTWYLVEAMLSQEDEVLSIEQSIGHMTNEIIDKYLRECYCIAVVTESRTSPVALIIPTSYIHISIYKKHINDSSIDELLTKSLDQKCDAFIFQVSDPITYIRRMVRLYKKSKQRHNRKYLILPTDLTKDNLETIYNVLEMEEMNLIPDMMTTRLNINKTGYSIDLLTHKFVGRNNSNEIILLNVWCNNHFLYSSQMYPNKLLNLHEKIIPFATTIYLPYATTDEEQNFDGTEVRISQELSRQLNGTPVYIIDLENEFGEVFENDTGNGILGNLAENRAEIGFASLGTWYYEYQHLDMSFPYLRTAVTCLAPKPRLLPGWMTIWLPFSSKLWYCVLVALISSAVVHFIFFKSYSYITEASANRSLDSSVLLIIGLLLGQSPMEHQTEGVNGPNRHIINWLTVMFMLITTSYSSGLASILTIPKYEQPIDTMEDLAYSNLIWSATHEAWAFDLRGSTDYIARHVYLQFRVFKEKELERRAFGRGTAFAMERLQAGHYAVGSYITEKSVSNLRIMKNDVYWIYITSFARKGSCYMEKYNELVHRIMDSGLILAWEGQVVRKFMSNTVQRAIRASGTFTTNTEPKVLQTTHVQGEFIVLMLGFLTALLTFITELFMFKLHIL